MNDTKSEKGGYGMSNNADNIELRIQELNVTCAYCVTENVLLNKWSMSFVSFIRISSSVFNQFTYLIIE